MVGLELILRRLAGLDGVLEDAVLDTSQTRKLPSDERRLDLDEPYPLRVPGSVYTLKLCLSNPRESNLSGLLASASALAVDKALDSGLFVSAVSIY
jgi:hypothetical protein